MIRRRPERVRERDHTKMVRLWFEFLRLNPSYRECCITSGKGEHAELYADFGDVHAMSFEDWYVTRRDLFEPQYFHVTTVDGVEDFKQFSQAGTGVAFLAVNLDKPRSDLVAHFDELLKELIPSRPGRRRGHDPSMAKYPIQQGPKVATLRKILDAHLLKARDPEVPDWKIGQLVYAPNAEKNKQLAADEKAKYGVQGSRALSQARALITNSALNRFPIDRPVDPSREFITYFEAATQVIAESRSNRK